MGRRKDYTGIDQTCPIIDAVRDFLEAINEDDTGADLSKGIREACLNLEKIRKMNSDLRDFGNEQYYDRDEAESDRDYYKDKVGALEDEVKSLKKELQDL